VKKIGATVGRESSTWVDVDLFGNQITFIKSPSFNFNYHNYRFGDSIIPAFHFGVLIDRKTWESLYDRLSKGKITITEKRIYLKDAPGEHHSYFLEDPNGYTVEFKSFSKEGDIFKR
jgi:hypothetical protein